MYVTEAYFNFDSNRYCEKRYSLVCDDIVLMMNFV